MAAQAEEPLATAADLSPSTNPLQRRPSPDDREEEKEESSRDAKRRRTCVAALESLETGKTDSLDSFSFDARSVAPIETTPKFGSFNPVLLLETTTVVESTEPPLPEKISDDSLAEEAKTEGEGEDEGGSSSKGKHGNSECSETE